MLYLLCKDLRTVYITFTTTEGLTQVLFARTTAHAYHTHTPHAHAHVHPTHQHSTSNAIDKEVDQAKHIPTEGHVVVCLQERRAAGTGLGLLRSPQRELLLPTTRPSTWSSLNDRLTLSFSYTGVYQEFMRQGALHSDWRITSVNKVTCHCPIT